MPIVIITAPSKKKERVGTIAITAGPTRSYVVLVLRRDYLFLLVVAAFLTAFFLWCRFLCFVVLLAFMVPVEGVAAAAGFGAGLFLFCAANADVPARAIVKTRVIRVFFINFPP